MNKKMIKFLSLTLTSVCVLTGCSSKKVDISSLDDSYSPDMSLTNINKTVENMKESEDIMYKFNTYTNYGYMAPDLDEYLQTNIYNSTDETIIQKNINKLYNSLGFLLSLSDKTTLEKQEKEIMKTIKDYIEYSRNNKDLEVSISEELSKSDAKNLIQEYITKNNIVITEIKYGDKLEDTDYLALPAKCGYTYTVIGYIQNGKEQVPFEKEFKQDFYINLNDEYLEKNDDEEKEMKFVIEGIVPFNYEEQFADNINNKTEVSKEEKQEQ